MQEESYTQQVPYYPPPGQIPMRFQPRSHPAGKPELVFGLALLICNIFLFNSILAGGINLGFALGGICVMGCSVGYLLSRGYRPSWYSGSLLALAVVIAAGFARSGDAFVQYILLHFLLVAVNLGLCLMADRNRWSPAGVRSLLDVPITFFGRGFGNLEASGRGLIKAIRETGAFGKKGIAVALGLLIAIPVMAVLVTLLMFADAAFEGLLGLLPDINWAQHVAAALLGTMAAWVLYSRGLSLHREPGERKKTGEFRGIPVLTVNTILIGVCLVYLVYLLSQLAYFFGGFSGILPKGYTLAQYARRGFFEMAWLCAIDLAIIAAGIGFVAKQERAPRLTRLLCLFIGIVTMFFVVTASAKMFLYIGSYGLTRLRVLTEVIMIWLGLATVLVCLWLFLPKLAYMKAVMLLALAMGAAVIWTDVDTLVARYNVRAYQSGVLETVDVAHLSQLGPGAVPYLAELTEDANPEIARMAQDSLEGKTYTITDFRDWNYAKSQAVEILNSLHIGEDDGPSKQ